MQTINREERKKGREEGGGIKLAFMSISLFDPVEFFSWLFFIQIS